MKRVPFDIRGVMEGSARWLCAAGLALSTAGCGLQAPDLQFPFSKPADLHMTLDHIVNEVKCELTHGILRAIARDDLLAEQNKTPPKLGWLESWSALATLTLTAEEISSLNPSITYTDILSNDIRKFPNGNVTTSRAFSLGAGMSVLADGTRTGKVNFFFVFKDFLTNPEAPAIDLTIPCEHQSPVLLESHLKLDDWIEQALYPPVTNANLTPVGYNQPTSLISHEVNFLIKVSGNINPVWKLIPVSFNTGALPFLQANRNQTNDLLITLGQTAAAEAGKKAAAAPSNEVLFSHLASEIGTAVATSTRGPLP
jgi:hypothetical protein